jgi:hypothetical protein
MTPINTIDDFDKAINHPYRVGEFLFLPQTGSVLCVNHRQNVVELLDELNQPLMYGIHWEGDPIEANCGDIIESVY